MKTKTIKRTRIPKNAPLIVERIFDAPPAIVWQALTEKEKIREWSFDIKEFKPKVGFEFQMTAEKDSFKYVHLCKITKVVRNKVLAYTWRYKGYEGDSLVTTELFPEGKKTRVKLTHEGLETFPKIDAFKRENFQMGWTAIIGEYLKNFVESLATKDREILISREFDAPRELVWQAMTDPMHVVQWWGPRGFTTTIEKMDLRVGGEWKHTMHGPDGADYPNRSRFLEVVAPERLVFSHGGRGKDGPEATFVATWTFDAVSNKKTRVTARMVFPTVKIRDQVVKAYGAIEGGKQTFERLGEHLANAKNVAREFFISRIFDAPRELVWKAWTDPKHITQWWGPKHFTAPVVEMDFRPKGKYRFVMRGPDGNEYPLIGIFREIKPPEKLVMTTDHSELPAAWHEMVNPNRDKSKEPELTGVQTVTFEKIGDKTRLTIRVRFDSAELRNALLKCGMTEGWSQTLEKLAACVSKMK
jgi:uncharacterized protein YndB with AHSA1/START domain